MFNLLKDIEKYKGIPPYASELYGVYQPLLGWRSSLTLSWLNRTKPSVDPLVRRILDANISPKPLDVGFDPAGTVDDRHRWLAEQRAIPIGLGDLKSPYRISMTRELGSEFL